MTDHYVKCLLTFVKDKEYKIMGYWMRLVKGKHNYNLKAKKYKL